MSTKVTVLAVLLALTVLAYAQTWRAGFVYEDMRTVFGTGQVQQTTPWQWRDLRSLSVLSFRFNHMLDGNQPRGYHAVNVGLHLLNGLLAYALAVQLGLTELGALLALTLFLLSPIQSESVAYVTGRTELLAAGAVLLACVLVTRPPVWWQALAVPAVLLVGLLTKETAAVGFVLVPLVWITQQPDRLARLRQHGTVPSELLLGGAIVAGLALWLLHPLRSLDPGAIGSERSLLGFVAIQSAALWHYMGQVIIPVGLTIDNDTETIPHWLGYLAIVGLIGLAVAAWRLRLRMPLVSMGLAWMLLAISPRLFVRIPEWLSDHHTMLPFVGLYLACGALLGERVSADRALTLARLSGNNPLYGALGAGDTDSLPDFSGLHNDSERGLW